MKRETIFKLIKTAPELFQILQATNKKAFRPYNEAESIKVLESAISELRRLYDHISNIYDQLRVKALALIAGEVAIITFIFTADKNGRPYVPHEIDRQIFYFAGILALLIAFVLLLWIISSVQWKLAHDTVKSDKLLTDFPTHLDFLKYLNDYYARVNDDCIRIVTNKCKKFNWVVYLLAGGVIILMVITKFGGRLS